MLPGHICAVVMCKLRNTCALFAIPSFSSKDIAQSIPPRRRHFLLPLQRRKSTTRTYQIQSLILFATLYQKIITSLLLTVSTVLVSSSALTFTVCLIFLPSSQDLDSSCPDLTPLFMHAINTGKQLCQSFNIWQSHSFLYCTSCPCFLHLFVIKESRCSEALYEKESFILHVTGALSCPNQFIILHSAFYITKTSFSPHLSKDCLQTYEQSLLSWLLAIPLKHGFASGQRN